MIVLNQCEEVRWTVISRAVEKEYRFFKSLTWLSSEIDFKMPCFPLQVRKFCVGYGLSALEWPGVAEILLSLNFGGTIVAEIHAVNKERLIEVEAFLKGWLPERVCKENDLLVTFWTYGLQGPRSYCRTLLAPSWDSIKPNYAAGTRESLAALQGVQPDVESGKLILWTGSPGTGKSWALRGLARSWQDWCQVHYILDPEHFFGEHSDYLTQVLLGGECFVPSPVGSSAQHSPIPSWRLVVLEDTGELLSADAKSRSGQGLSRLLNVCDGLIGQGLRILILITTNEELGELHKAVMRPGRCLANIKFGPLSREEVRAWLDTRGLSEIEPTKTILSDLYAISNERGVIQNSEQKYAVGFLGK